MCEVQSWILKYIMVMVIALNMCIALLVPEAHASNLA